ncbi:MAG: DNA polymerase IV [Planctomycetota bacterium]|jgi:DNA polymerase-4
MAAHRVILHADMDAFYASVEQRDNPSLRGKPVVVGGPSRRGVVSAASYEARTFGIHSAMPMAQALKRCPDLVAIFPRMKHYAQISRQVFAILEAFSPLLEPLSLDEAFVDLTGTQQLHGDALEVGRTIKRRVREELDLVVSVGIAPNKFVAKVASDLGKPDGLVLVGPDEVERFLHPLPVSRIFGVGQVTQKTLAALGIETIGALAAFPQDQLVGRLGEHGDQLWALARGQDDRAVVPHRAPKSVGHENTFSEDKRDLDELTRIVQEQADRVARRLRRQGLLSRTVVLKVKTADFKQRTRRRRLHRATSDGDELGKNAGELLAKLLPGLGPVRLTGVTAADLSREEEPRQLTFDEPQHCQRDQLAKTLDRISDRFGLGTVTRASALEQTTGTQQPLAPAAALEELDEMEEPDDP